MIIKSKFCEQNCTFAFANHVFMVKTATLHGQASLAFTNVFSWAIFVFVFANTLFMVNANSTFVFADGTFPYWQDFHAHLVLAQAH